MIGINSAIGARTGVDVFIQDQTSQVIGVTIGEIECNSIILPPGKTMQIGTGIRQINDITIDVPSDSTVQLIAVRNEFR